MSASDVPSSELARALRALPTGAPPRLRRHIETLGEPAPIRLRLPSLRRTLWVLAPACAVVVVAAGVVHGVLSSESRTTERALPAAGHNGRSHAAVGTVADSPFAPHAQLPGPTPARHQDYEADLRVRVDDLRALGRESAAAMLVARQLGGYVASVDQSSAPGLPGEADLVLRIPVGHVERAMIRLAALGTVLEQHVSIVDLEAAVQRERDRIRALRVRIARLDVALRESLPVDVRLRLQFQLADARQALERATGAQTSTLRRAALARISLALTTQHAVAATQHHRGRFGRSLVGAVDFLAAAGAVALLVLVVISPLGLIVLLVWAARLGWRRREERRLFAEA